MGLFRRAGSPFHWMNIRRPGQRTLRKSTGVRIDGGTPYQTGQNLALAKAMLSIEEAAYTRARYGTDLTPPAPSIVPTLERFFEDTYVPWAKRERPDTADQTERRLKAIFYPLFRTLRLDEIRPAAIAEWRAQRLATDVQKQSVDRELVYLLGVISYAVELEILDASPLAKLTITSTPSPEIIRYLSDDEDARLMRALAVRDASWIAARQRFNAHRAARKRPPLRVPPHFKDWLTPVVVLSLYCGLRRKEVFHSKWTAIDWHAKVITVTAKIAKNKTHVRRVPMNSLVQRVLRAWRDQIGNGSEYIFVSRNGRRLTYVQSSWDAVLADARITAFRWHDMRHTFASWLVQSGERLEVVQQLCGHRNLKTTMRYAHLAPTQLSDAVNRLSA